MKTFLITFVILSWVSFSKAEPLNPNYGTFCSMSTRDGQWAFSFAETSIQMNCWRTQTALKQLTFSPIYRQNNGYFSRYGMNEVIGDCYYFQERFYGSGVYPLQVAYTTLRKYATDCIFYVRH